MSGVPARNHSGWYAQSADPTDTDLGLDGTDMSTVATVPLGMVADLQLGKSWDPVILLLVLQDCQESVENLTELVVSVANYHICVACVVSMGLMCSDMPPAAMP